MRELLTEIGLPPHPIRAYEDNTSTRQLANDPGKLRNRSKHFELRFMAVQELVQRALISMVYVPTKYQLADLLTKQVYHGGYVLSYHAYAHWIRSFRSLPVHFVITFLRWVPLMGPRLAAHPRRCSFFFSFLLSSPSSLSGLWEGVPAGPCLSYI